MQIAINLIRTSDVNFLRLKVINRLLLKSLQVTFASPCADFIGVRRFSIAKPTTAAQYKDSDNLPIIKGIY